MQARLREVEPLDLSSAQKPEAVDVGEDREVAGIELCTKVIC
jgi:hypothetical protein